MQRRGGRRGHLRRHGDGVGGGVEPRRPRPAVPGRAPRRVGPAAGDRRGDQACPPATRRRGQFGSTTVSTTWIKPFDWNQLAIVIRETSPLSSATTMSSPCMRAVSDCPSAVLSFACPPPSAICFLSALLLSLPGTT